MRSNTAAFLASLSAGCFDVHISQIVVASVVVEDEELFNGILKFEGALTEEEEIQLEHEMSLIESLLDLKASEAEDWANSEAEVLAKSLTDVPELNPVSPAAVALPPKKKSIFGAIFTSAATFTKSVSLKDSLFDSTSTAQSSTVVATEATSGTRVINSVIVMKWDDPTDSVRGLYSGPVDLEGRPHGVGTFQIADPKSRFTVRPLLTPFKSCAEAPCHEIPCKNPHFTLLNNASFLAFIFVSVFFNFTPHLSILGLHMVG
jgi:hypothetical protein